MIYRLAAPLSVVALTLLAIPIVGTLSNLP